MEIIFEEIMAENIPNLIKTGNPQIQEAQQTPKQNKHEENYIKAYLNQIAKETSDKQKIYSSQRKR